MRVHVMLRGSVFRVQHEKTAASRYGAAGGFGSSALIRVWTKRGPQWGNGFCPSSFQAPLGPSIPKPFCRQIGPLPHGLELLPHDSGVDLGLVKRLRGEPTVRPGHYILAPDQLGKADEPFSNPFRMLDDVANTCSRSKLALSASRPQIRDMNTNITCSSG